MQPHSVPRGQNNFLKTPEQSAMPHSVRLLQKCLLIHIRATSIYTLSKNKYNISSYVFQLRNISNAVLMCVIVQEMHSTCPRLGKFIRAWISRNI